MTLGRVPVTDGVQSRCAPMLRTGLGDYPSIIDRALVPFETFTDETEALSFLKQERYPR